MTKNSGFATYILEEVLQDITGVTQRRMFGGYGLYKDGVIFGMIIDDKLYFKATEKSKKLFEQHNAQPFTYIHNKTGKTVTMPYNEVPEEILEDKNTLTDWIEASVAKK